MTNNDYYFPIRKQKILAIPDFALDLILKNILKAESTAKTSEISAMELKTGKDLLSFSIACFLEPGKERINHLKIIKTLSHLLTEKDKAVLKNKAFEYLEKKELSQVKNSMKIFKILSSTNEISDEEKNKINYLYTQLIELDDDE